MKCIFITLTLFALSFNAKAQMSELFYNTNWNQLKAFVDSVKLAVPGFNVIESTISKSGKEHTFILKDSTGRTLKASALRHQLPNQQDKIGTIQLKSDFQTLVLIYKKYILTNAPIDTTSTNECWPVIVRITKTGKMPISFCHINKNDWVIYNKYPL